MQNRTVVIRRRSCSWHPNTNVKIKTKKTRSNAGFINPVFVVFACAVFSGLVYLYSINRTAVKGLAIRQIENEIAQTQKENENLKIKEAELKSLYHIEEQSKQLNMEALKDAQYVEENAAVAMAPVKK